MQQIDDATMQQALEAGQACQVGSLPGSPASYDGEQVVDVPAKLAARARLFDTGHDRKTDAQDAHAVAEVTARTQGLRVLAYDVELEALRMLADRREELTWQRVQTVKRLRRLLSELTRARAKRDITALQAKAILASVWPRDLAGRPDAGSPPSS